MGDNSINSVPHYGTKQYYVNTIDGASVVKVSFNSNSSSTTRQATGSGNGVLISIGTKNLATNADITNAVNRAVFTTQVNAAAMVDNSAANIINSADDALKAASVTIPNEDVMGLLL